MAKRHLSASLAAAFAIGCGTNERPDFTDGNIFDPCWQQCTPDPGGVCQHTCTVDPGPRPVNCAEAEANYVFSGFIGDFNSPLATGFYSYTDNSQAISTFVNRETDKTVTRDPKTLKPSRKTWEPPTVPIPRCTDPNDPTKVVDNSALHVQGGPFLSWGGGVGKSMKNFAMETMSRSMPATWQDAIIDASQWEGLSFWARRGPDSQAGFRVLVGDKSTDDDISYLMYREDPMAPRFCERVRECACLNHKACEAIPRKVPRVVDGGVVTSADGAVQEQSNPVIPTDCAPDDNHFRPGETTMTFCGEPMAISGADQAGSAGASACNTCMQTRCDERYPAYPDDPMNAPAGTPIGTDRQFWGKPCTPFTYRNGISSMFCFDPMMGEKPAETTEQCGDHWTRVVNLSNEWQFYTVPFNTMTQQGWAQRTEGLDLTSVSVIRFTWDGGWVDFWIDDVRFYKHR